MNRYTQNHAANKTADSPSQRKPQAGTGRANEQTNDHGPQVMSNTAKTLGVRGGGGQGVGWGGGEQYGTEGDWKTTSAQKAEEHSV